MTPHKTDSITQYMNTDLLCGADMTKTFSNNYVKDTQITFLF